MRRTLLPALGAPTALLALSACGGGADEYCTTLTDDPGIAAVVYAPLIPGMDTVEDAQARLDLVTAAEEDAPEELAEDLATWKDYLETAVQDMEEDPNAVLEQGNSAEVSSAGDALSEHYTSTCMG